MSKSTPAPGSFLLDTNVAIRILNGSIDLAHPQAEATETFLCLTVAGELLYGAEKSQNVTANRDRVRALLDRCPLLPQDLEVADRYARLKTWLRRSGRPIPDNDLWIAATAVRWSVRLVTGDQHFDDPPGLSVERW